MMRTFAERLICYAVSFALTAAICLSIICGALSVTLADDNYLIGHFTKSKTITALVAELDEQYEPLSQSTNIDKAVFTQAVDYNFIRSVQRTVVEGTRKYFPLDFRGQTDIEKRFEAAIKEHDKANKIKRSTKDLNKITQQAVDIFNDVCAIKNNAQLAPIANFLIGKTVRLTLLFVIAAIACVVLEYFINQRRHKHRNYIAMALVTAGELLLAVPALIVVTGMLDRLTLTNIDAYNLAIKAAAQNVFYVLMAFGAVLIVSGIVMFASVYRYYKIKLTDLETENEITRNLI